MIGDVAGDGAGAGWGVGRCFGGCLGTCLDWRGWREEQDRDRDDADCRYGGETVKLFIT